MNANKWRHVRGAVMWFFKCFLLQKRPMKYTAHIRNNETGEVRITRWDHKVDQDVIEYLWSDGNYGCDCNREIFFLNDPQCGSRCGDQERYAVNLEKDGEVFYREFNQ